MINELFSRPTSSVEPLHWLVMKGSEQGGGFARNQTFAIALAKRGKIPRSNLPLPAARDPDPAVCVRQTERLVFLKAVMPLKESRLARFRDRRMTPY